uniref:Angiotensin-converting enzyme 2 n=1 Tax=Kalanchoe fedtschenkoi TaxID=63787 RepID=A0A7N0TXP4_KALFE
MSNSSASYIHMVQHLIEKCLIFHMTKEECMEALSKHGNIQPVITSTVWSELEKENKEFFKLYTSSQVKVKGGAETGALIHKMISDTSKDDSDE